MSESGPTSPSSAPVLGSFSSGSTSKARKSPMITVPRRITAVGMMSIIVIVILLWVAALTIPMRNGFLVGAAGGGCPYVVCQAAAGSCVDGCGV